MTDLSGNYVYDCQEELNRKTYEALELLDQQHRSGRMSDSAYRGALEGVDLCTRGLTPEMYSLAIDNEIGNLPEKDKLTSIWAAANAVYLISMNVGDDYFIVRTIPAGEGKKIVRGEDLDTVKDAVRKFHKFEAKLKANGYRQL
jgi:hypothetical protein